MNQHGSLGSGSGPDLLLPLIASPFMNSNFSLSRGRIIGRMSAPSSTPRTRLQEFLVSVPLVTLTLFSICVLVYIADNLGDFNRSTSLFSISAFLVIFEFQWYRIISAAFTHLGLLHIIMNMFALVQIGGSLEPLFGSLQYFFVISVFVLAVGVLYVVLMLLLGIIWPQYLLQSEFGRVG